MSTATTVALGSRRRPQPGSSVDRPQVPLLSLAISVGAHAALAVGLIAGAAMWKASQPKVIVVNLVPAIPAVGVPKASPTATPTPAPTPRSVEEPPPRVSKPAPDLPVRPPEPKPREIPVRETPLPPPSPLPPRELPTRETPVRETPPLDRPLPPRSPATARAGEKELPAVPRFQPPRPVPQISPPTPQPLAPQPAPPREVPVPARGLPSGSPAGSGALALKTDGNFQYNWYFQEMLRRINDKWRPPGQSVEGQRVVVLFEIARNGQVLSSEVEESSGNFLYDQAALRAVVESGPFRELPADFTERSIRIHMGFQFTNRG
jgi:TonB family protein